jgi:hypothetical protein
VNATTLVDRDHPVRTTFARTPASRLFVAIVIVAALAGCGQAKDRALCSQTGDLAAAAQQMRDLDPSKATADDVRSIANDVLAELDQVQAVSDGAYDTAISMTRTAVTDLRDAATDLGDQQLAVARPLLRDSLEDAVVAYRLLERRIDIACGPS